MLKMGDSVMFTIGKTSKVFKVTCDQFTIDGTPFVAVEGYRGFVNVTALVKMQNLFEATNSEFEEPTEDESRNDEIGEPKEHHILDDEERLMMEEIKSHIGAGIRKLKKRGVRSVNIELELVQFMHKQLR